MSERVEKAVRSFQQWSILNVWWLWLLSACLQLFVLLRGDDGPHFFGPRTFSVLFQLAGALAFWFAARRFKKLEVERRKKLELEAGALQP